MKRFYIPLLTVIVLSCTKTKEGGRYDPNTSYMHNNAQEIVNDTNITQPTPSNNSSLENLPKNSFNKCNSSDNMRGFDPASEDDMDDNGMSRYMENNDEEGWD